MSRQNKKPSGCGCSNIPISIIIAILGGGYWWFIQPGNLDISRLLPKNIPITNSSVSFDICHHNPYWAKRYFAADWQQWNVDQVFIQAYNEANFKEELNYAKNYAGIAISERQFHRLKELIDNPAIKSILVFPLAGKPEETASSLKSLTQNNGYSPPARRLPI
ncbi:hypothetical protein [Scytonema hofmannii]|uniref:hypothetical protein n=1 Tax=Scytonema hofmannii TaxID=34078 RepID=UPI00034970E1